MGCGNLRRQAMNSGFLISVIECVFFWGTWLTSGSVIQNGMLGRTNITHGEGKPSHLRNTDAC
jgi:hypothetical protein